jgi:hypothetical protein
MADTITLEQVRDQLRSEVELIERDRLQYPENAYRTSSSTLDDLADAIDAAIEQREQGANNPLKGWIFDKVNMGRGDERYICTPDGANATTVRNESTSDHRERLLWLIADAMAKESGNG